LVFIFILSAISLPCDALFIFAYICPTIFTLLVLLISGYNKRKILKLALVCVSGFLLGMVILDKIKFNSIFTITKSPQCLTLEAIMNSWNVFFSQMKAFLSELSFKTLTTLLSIITYIWTIYYCITEFIAIKRRKKEISLFFIFQLFVCFFIPILMLAPILNGSYIDWGIIRYNYYIFILLLFNLIVLANHYVKKQRYLVIGLNSLFSISLSIYLLWNILNMDFTRQLKVFFNCYPQNVSNFDELFTTEDDVTYYYGFTCDYWCAKYTTMFSKKNIRIYHGWEDATPRRHVTNENWFFGGGKGKHSNPQFTFLVWDTDKNLPNFFIEQNPPYKSCSIDENKTLYFVKPFIFDRETMQPKLLNQFNFNSN